MKPAIRDIAAHEPYGHEDGPHRAAPDLRHLEPPDEPQD